MASTNTTHPAWPAGEQLSLQILPGREHDPPIINSLLMRFEEGTFLFFVYVYVYITIIICLVVVFDGPWQRGE